MEDFSAKRQALLDSGVKMMDPDTVYVEESVTVGPGTLLLPGTILRGRTVVGANCEIGPNTMLVDCTVGDGVTINSSQCNESTIDSGAHVGPFAYIRPNCHVGADVKVGDFVELKNSTIGEGTKISHLTYVGDRRRGTEGQLWLRHGAGQLRRQPEVPLHHWGPLLYRLQHQSGLPRPHWGWRLHRRRLHHHSGVEAGRLGHCPGPAGGKARLGRRPSAKKDAK